MSFMETRRWVNQSQPQTLYMATILLYFSAALGLLFGGLAPIGLLFVAGEAFGAYGIANERKWGYVLALAIVAVQLGFLGIAISSDPGALFSLEFVIAAIWPVAVCILLLHPQSREYQKIWFN